MAARAPVRRGRDSKERSRNGFPVSSRRRRNPLTSGVPSVRGSSVPESALYSGRVPITTANCQGRTAGFLTRRNEGRSRYKSCAGSRLGSPQGRVSCVDRRSRLAIRACRANLRSARTEPVPRRRSSGRVGAHDRVGRQSGPLVWEAEGRRPGRRRPRDCDRHEARHRGFAGRCRRRPPVAASRRPGKARPEWPRSGRGRGLRRVPRRRRGRERRPGDSGPPAASPHRRRRDWTPRRQPPPPRRRLTPARRPLAG